MNATLAAFACGLIFGLGLLVSGMSNPAKVLGFLDLASIAERRWDPSLALVMAGAVMVAGLGFRSALRRPKPWFAPGFLMPRATALEGRIFAGAGIFGIGWGLAGLCPGPALTLLGTGRAEAVLFLLAMTIGMAGARWLAARGARAAAVQPR